MSSAKTVKSPKGLTPKSTGPEFEQSIRPTSCPDHLKALPGKSKRSRIPSDIGLFRGFREVFDVGQTFEVVVLGPDRGFVGEGGGVDDGIGERELVLDEEVGCVGGNAWVQGDNDSRKHGVGDRLGLLLRSLLEDDLADFGDDDCGDDQVGQLAEDWGEVAGVGAVIEALDPCGSVEKVGGHGACGSDFAILFPFEHEWLGFAEKTDELVGSQDGADFDLAVLLDELEALAGFEIHGFSDFFGDDNLKFG